MSALSQNNTPVDNEVQASADASGAQAPAFALTVGPHALAAKAIWAMMSLYNEIIQWDQQQKQDMVQAQAREAQGAANATRKAGEISQFYGIIGGAASAGGAALSAGASMAMMHTGEVQKAQNKSNEIESEKNINTKLQGLIGEPNKGNPMSTTADTKEPTFDELSKGPFDKDNNKNGFKITDDVVAKRAEEIKSGNYSNVEDIEPVFTDRKEKREAIARRNDSNNQITKQALGEVLRADPEFKVQLEKDQTQLSQDLHSATLKVTTAAQNANTVTGIINPFSASISSVSQAVGGAKRAKEEANNTLFSAAQNLAANSASSFEQAATKADDANKGAVQVLNAMDQSNGKD